MKACNPFVARWWLAPIASVVLSTPIPVLAQSMPGHDMSSMPGMDMGPQKTDPEDRSKPALKPALKPSSKKPVVKKSKAKDASTSPVTPTPEADMPMKDHDMSSMPGMAMDPGHDAMPGMGHDAMPGMNHDAMPGMDHDAMPGMDHGAMQMTPARPAMDMPMTKPGDAAGSGMPASIGAMQGGAAPSDARDPDAYADGLEMGHMHGMDMADDAKHLYVLGDRLEVTKTHDGHGQALDAQAWYGGDLDKLWLKVDGERSDGRLGATRTEALWHHAIATYWGLQTGVRQDFGDGPGRTWAAFGVQGLSPYWFDIQATAYVGEGGRTALRVETEYDLLLTQRLILQPDVKVGVFGRDDARRGIGAGLSEMEAGLRLRYEFTRKIAPYVGVVWNRKFGNTARFARQEDGPAQKIEAVAGMRFWF